MKFAYIMAAAAGIGVTLQGAANALIGRTLGFWETTFAVSLANALIVGVLLLFGVGSGSFTPFRELSWPILLLGATMGPIIIFGMAYAFANSSGVVAISVSIVAQLILSLIIDHFGLLGVPQSPINGTKILGVLLLLAGTQMIIHK